VKASIERHQDPANGSVALREVAQITEMRIVDDDTMVFVLANPWGTFPFVLADSAGMITNPAVLEELGKDAFGLDPVGAGVGPFEVERYVPNEELVLKAKDDYWRGAPCLETLRFIDADDQATLDSLRKGDIDLAFIRTPSLIAEAKQEFEHFADPNYLGWMLAMNSTPGRPLADVRIRQAVAHAVDAEAYNQRVYDGKGIASTVIVPEPYPMTPGVPGPALDPARARDLIAQARADGWDGRVSVIANTPSLVDAGLTIEAMLEAVGIDVELELLTPQEGSRRVFVDRDYDINIGSAGATNASPIVRLQRFFQTGNTFTGFSDPQFDALLNDLRIASTTEEMKAALRPIQERWNEVIPSHGLQVAENLMAWHDGVHGLILNGTSTIFFDEAWVER